MRRSDQDQQEEATTEPLPGVWLTLSSTPNRALDQQLSMDDNFSCLEGKTTGILPSPASPKSYVFEKQSYREKKESF